MKKSYQSLEDISTYQRKSQDSHIIRFKNLILSFIVFLIASTISVAQEGDPANGKTLFNTNCASCHALDRKMTGPALRNVQTRLEEDEGLDIDWLRSWIRNSAAVIKSGDAYANKIYDEYNQSAMTAFPQLDDQNIADILAYTAAEPDTGGGGTDTAVAPVVVEQGGISNETQFLAAARW